MIEWQPIETAPRDGTEIILMLGAENGKLLAWISSFIDTETFSHGKLIRKSQHWQMPMWAVSRELEPTHWMPIPKAPGNA